MYPIAVKVTYKYHGSPNTWEEIFTIRYQDARRYTRFFNALKPFITIISKEWANDDKLGFDWLMVKAVDRRAPLPSTYTLSFGL